MYWIAYVTLGLAVGLIVGYLQGTKSGFTEGWHACVAAQREAHGLRGRKAAETRMARMLAKNFYDPEGTVTTSVQSVEVLP